MNEYGREALVTASLNGTRQGKGIFLSPSNRAVCAMGAMHLAVHAWNWSDAAKCQSDVPSMKFVDYPCMFAQKCGIDKTEIRQEIIDANDRKGWDFLTIARKCGFKETNDNV